MRGLLKMLAGAKSEHPRGGMPPCIPDDELYAIFDEYGLTSSASKTYSEQEASQDLERIMSLDTSPAIKYDLLTALDVKIQNQCDHGWASPVTNDVLAAQWELVEEMRNQ